MQSQRPTPPTYHEVKQGDCIASIACERGLHPDTIWRHPENAELRRLREDRNILFPGDRVFLPEKQRKDVSAASDARHRFRRKGVPEMLQLVLQDQHDRPRVGVEYVLTIDGIHREGVTGEDGVIECPIPPDARDAILRLRQGEQMVRYRLPLGHLDPISEVRGVQMRLRNLEFYGGEPDGELDEETLSAVEDFQRHHGLEPNGRLDEVTRNKIEEVHRS
jgi:hypothetical protein